MLSSYYYTQIAAILSGASQSLQSCLLAPIMADETCINADLRGKTAIVTGANSGIGLEIARKLTHMGCHVVLACRDLDKAAEAKKQLKPLEKQVTVMQLDCASRKSVDAFVQSWGQKPLDILVNNAGCIAGSFALAESGYERSFEANFLSHYVLALRLLPVLTPGARIIETSSAAQFRTTRHFVDPQDMDMAHMVAHRGVLPGERLPQDLNFVMYMRTKMFQCMFCAELQRRLDAHKVYAGKNIRVNAYHPGIVKSPIWTKPDHLSKDGWTFATRMNQWVFTIGVTPEQGAVTAVALATQDLGRGEYFYRQSSRYANPLVYDRDLVLTLWAKWADMTGVDVA